jgi:Tfp pilus assembly protein PilF
VAYAKLYEKHGDLNAARTIFKKATQVEFRTVDDLASVWCEWAEMELRQNHYDEALKTLQQACTIPRIVRLTKVHTCALRCPLRGSQFVCTCVPFAALTCCVRLGGLCPKEAV